MDYILCSQRWRSKTTESAKIILRADYDSDHEFLIAKFTVKLKKVGKPTIPFRYDLNQIPYDYTVEVTNRFQGLDLIGRVPEELWMEVRDIVQQTVIKTIPKKNKSKKAKWLSDKALQIVEKIKSESEVAQSCDPLRPTLWIIAHQAPPSIKFSRQEYCNELPFTSPGDLSDPGVEPASPLGRQILLSLNHLGK